MTDEGDEPGLGLDEVLAALRHDLSAARDDTDTGDYGLGVREVEIELSVEISRRRDAEGQAGVKWFVLSGDVRGSAGRDRTDAHRIRLTLGPVAAGSPGATGPSGGSDNGPAGGEPIGPAIADR